MGITPPELSTSAAVTSRTLPSRLTLTLAIAHLADRSRTRRGAQGLLMAVHIIDQSKAIAGDFRHRALRHHAEGIFLLETIFGQTITLSNGRVIPTRWIGEQHVQQDLGFIPSFADWMRAIRPLPWMGRAGRLKDRPAAAGPAPQQIDEGEPHHQS